MNNHQLYPFTFHTIFKDKIWGGEKIKTILNKDFGDLPNCGETWELSGVEGNISIVNNGTYAERDLKSLIQEFKGDLVGEKVYQHFGDEFPLLIKFIDANADLSIQVHPDDKLASERHNSKGKTEMWYVLQADKGAKLISGFNQPMDEQKYLNHLNDGTLNKILNVEEVTAGDTYFMPAGRVHAIGSGVMLIEVQQTSDITYRIYDYDRTDAQGNKRELHTEQALAAIDYQFYDKYKSEYILSKNQTATLVDSPFFKTNVISLDKQLEMDNTSRDSFSILAIVEGNGKLSTSDIEINLNLGDVLLIPAALKKFNVMPTGAEMKLIESFIG